MKQVRKYKDTDLEAVLSAWENTQKIAHPFLPKDFQAQEKINIKELHLPNADTQVVEDDYEVVGFIALIGNEVGGLFPQPTHHGDLVVDVFEKNSIGRDFYAQYGFELIERKIHEETCESILRLKFTSNKVQ